MIYQNRAKQDLYLSSSVWSVTRRGIRRLAMDHEWGIHECWIARKSLGVRDVASILEEWRNSAEYLWAKFHLVPSLTRGCVPVTRKERRRKRKLWWRGGDNRGSKFESRKFAALDLVWKDLEAEWARYLPLHIIVACVLCSRGGIDFTFRGEENWLLITVGNFKIGKWNEWASIGDDLSLLWWWMGEWWCVFRGGGRNTAVGLINILLHCGGNRGEI